MIKNIISKNQLKFQKTFYFNVIGILGWFFSGKILNKKTIPVLGITGTGGAGKSSVTDELVRRFLHAYTDKTIAVISVDPSKKKTGGALLGDRIRMNSISNTRAYMRSLATRESDKALSAHVQEAIDICKEAGFDFIILESAFKAFNPATCTTNGDLYAEVKTHRHLASEKSFIPNEHHQCGMYLDAFIGWSCTRASHQTSDRSHGDRPKRLY